MTNLFIVVGATVSVQKPDAIYKFYVDFAKMAGYPNAAVDSKQFEDVEANKLRLPKGTIAKVVYVGKHLRNENIICVLEGEFGHRLFDISGLQYED